MITALAGGVGAARFLAGLTAVVPPESVTAIVNTADDDTFHGLHVSPDIDSVTYRLAGVHNPETGWGIVDESFTTIGELERFGVPTWFRLGDRDLATHLYRTDRLRAGVSLTEVTAEIARAWGIATRLLPMTDDPVRTMVTVMTDAGTSEQPMQEWFVRDQCEPPVVGVRFAGAAQAQPSPSVLDALREAEVIIVCPSNPLISIDPILAVPGIRAALTNARERVVAVSPLIAGRAVKGPAAAMFGSMGLDPSCVGVAARYADWCATMVIDTTDADRAAEVEALGVRAVVTDTLMQDARIAAALARTTLAAGR